MHRQYQRPPDRLGRDFQGAAKVGLSPFGKVPAWQGLYAAGWAMLNPAPVTCPRQDCGQMRREGVCRAVSYAFGYGVPQRQDFPTL